jgi:hypothetical protein
MGVKNDIPRMEMVHHQDVMVELSTHLLAAQHEMVEGQVSDLYA